MGTRYMHPAVLDLCEDRTAYAALRAEMAADSGDGDPWGWCMGWWFAIAGTLHDRGETVPAAWHYRPSPFGGVDPDDFNASLIAELDTTSPALVHAGNVLSRYAERCRRAGRDY